MSTQEIDQWLGLQPNTVRKAITVRSREEAGRLYHMSLDGNIKKFTPYVTRRAHSEENISVPRISTATSILGCFVGYLSSITDIQWPDWKSKKFKNGWYLYDLPYEYCLKPNKKMLFDTEYSDEHWLITYSPATREYKGNIVAKMFYSEIITLPINGKVPRNNVKLVVENLGDDPIVFGKDMSIGKGCWMISGPLPEQHGDWSDVKPYVVEQISYGEYAKLKGMTADMLSLEQPSTFKWNDVTDRSSFSFRKATSRDTDVIRMIEESTRDPFLGDIATTKKLTDVVAFYVGRQLVGFAIPRRDSDGRYRTGAIYITPSERKKGYAKLFLQAYFKDKRGRAFIEPSNLASQKLFSSVGFTRSGKKVTVESELFEEWLLNNTLPSAFKW